MSAYHKQFGLRGQGYAITTQQYQEILDRARADLSAGRNVTAYLGEKHAQKRVGDLMKGVEVPSAPKPQLDGINKSAQDYYRRLAAAEVMAERFKEMGKSPEDNRLRNELIKNATFRFGTAEMSGNPSAQFARHMPPLAATYAAAECRTRVMEGQSMTVVAAMLPALDDRMPARVGNTNPRWWTQDTPVAEKLQDHLAEHHQKLPAPAKLWAAEQNLVSGPEKNQGDPEFMSAVVSLSKSAAIVSAITAREAVDSKEFKKADRIFDVCLEQVGKLAQGAALRDLDGEGSYDKAMKTFQALEEHMRETDPETAQVFAQMQDKFALSYGEYEPQLAVDAAKMDLHATAIRPLADRLYTIAADQLQDAAKERGIDTGDAGDVDGEGQPVTGIGGLKPSDDFMKEDRSDPFFDRYEPGARFDNLKLDPANLKRMSKADIHDLKKTNLSTSEEQLIKDWEQIEKLLIGTRRSPAVVHEETYDLADIVGDGITREMRMQRELHKDLDLDHDFDPPAPKPSFAPSF